jgi:hypothetical protein
MAIVKAFEEFRPELMSIDPENPIRVLTDHKNLQSFMTTKQLSRRQARWSLFLSQFNFKISYAPGKENVEADALSRRKQDMPLNAEDSRITVNHQVVLKPHNVSEGMTPSVTDPALQAALTALSHSNNNDSNEITDEMSEELRIYLLEEGPEGGEEGTEAPRPLSLDNLDEDEPTTEVLLQEAYEEDPVPQEIFKLLQGEGRSMPRHLVETGHYFSLADCQVKGLHTDTQDRRRLWVNGRLYVPASDKLRRRLYAEKHDHPIACLVPPMSWRGGGGSVILL